MTAAVSVLAELESRAGASDQDREAWLAERRGGVTATEIRDLVLGNLRTSDLVDLKLGRKVDSFSGNEYTRWGTGREPIIADAIRLRHGIQPESRVFHGAGNPRYLASPDGVGITWDEEIVVSEIKTAGVDIAPGSQAFLKKGYHLQVQWAMHVTGAKRCLFAWERRVEVGPGEYEAGALQFEWIDYDLMTAAELANAADAFLEALDAAAAVDGPREFDTELRSAGLDYLSALNHEKDAVAAKKAAYDRVLGRALELGIDTVSDEVVRVTLSPQKTTVVTDMAATALAAAEADPGTFAALDAAQKAWDAVLAEHTLTKESLSTPRVTITRPAAPKQKVEAA